MYTCMQDFLSYSTTWYIAKESFGKLMSWSSPNAPFKSNNRFFPSFPFHSQGYFEQQPKAGSVRKLFVHRTRLSPHPFVLTAPRKLVMSNNLATTGASHSISMETVQYYQFENDIKLSLSSLPLFRTMFSSCIVQKYNVHYKFHGIDGMELWVDAAAIILRTAASRPQATDRGFTRRKTLKKQKLNLKLI